MLNDMYDTMLEFDGVGLAAPQIGQKLQIAIVDIDDEFGTIEMINPEILETDGEQTGPEGCLSFPGLYGEVTRPEYVKIKAQDRKGKFLPWRLRISWQERSSMNLIICMGCYLPQK